MCKSTMNVCYNYERGYWNMMFVEKSPQKKKYNIVIWSRSRRYSKIHLLDKIAELRGYLIYIPVMISDGIQKIIVDNLKPASCFDILIGFEKFCRNSIY